MRQTFKITQLIISLIILSNLLLADIASASFDNPCADALHLDLDGTFRGYDDAPNTSQTFVLEIPSAGVALVEIAVPGAAPTEPKLGSLGRHCAAGAIDRDVATVERSIKHQVIAFRTAGTYFFRVAAQDPRLPLGEYKLVTRFLTAETIDKEPAELKTRRDRLIVDQTDFYLTGSALKSEVDQVDPDPGNRHPGLEAELHVVTLYAPDPSKSEVDQVDPDPGARHSGLGTPAARLVTFEATLFPTSANSEVDQVDPDPGASYGSDPHKSEVDQVDPDPSATYRGSRTLRSVLTVFAPSDKSEVDQVDPDPGANYGSDPHKSEVDQVDPDPGLTYGADPRHSEVDQVDPDPGIRGTFATTITRAAFTVEDLDPARAADVSLVQWLADLTWPGASAGSREATGRYKLVAYERQSGAAARTFQLGGLCDRDADDFGDTFGCATALAANGRLSAEIANGWGDDSDTFALTIAELGAVRIETTGDTDTFGALYDRSGRRLATDDDGGDGANFQIVETLEPGQYFIRVEGSDRSEGSFELNVETLGW